MSMDEMTAAFARKEKLHPDLLFHLEHSPSGFQMLRHPLLYAVPYSEQMNAIYNLQYKARRINIQKSLEDNDWGAYVFWHEKPHRFSAFEAIVESLTDAEYWELLGQIWIGSENLWQVDNLAQLMNSDRPGRPSIMDAAELEAFELLPRILTIHRGHKAHNKYGWSWTLDLAKAEWFANRLRGAGQVSTITIYKSEALAYFSRRGEEEIVITPKTARKYLRLKAKDKRPC